MSTPRFAPPKLIATAVRRDYTPGGDPPQTESQGGLFTVDFATREVRQLVDWSSPEVDFRGRGLVFHGDEIYVAARDEVFVYGRDFRIRRSYQSSYLDDCGGAFRMNDHLYLLSAANDCILAFDLRLQTFFRGLHLAPGGAAGVCRTFDPLGIDGPGGAGGPPVENRLGLNSIRADRRGLFVSGARTGGLLYLRGNGTLERAVELPEGSHDARPFRDGVLFNDTAAGAVRFASRSGEERAFVMPVAESEAEAGPMPTDRPYARGLCALDEYRFAAGSSPATISLYDLEVGSRVASVRFFDDHRYAIHALEVWPFG
jgi:hypothetical protein